MVPEHLKTFCSFYFCFKIFVLVQGTRKEPTFYFCFANSQDWAGYDGKFKGKLLSIYELFRADFLSPACPVSHPDVLMG